jgi:hypothetical protein
MILFMSFPLATPGQMSSARLRQPALDAFHKYVQLAQSQFESALARGNPFLAVDMLPAAQRDAAYADLRAGKPYIERLSLLADGQPVNCPGGMIHHWIGTIFIPGVTLDQILALLQDYDHHARYYSPDVQRSKILSHSGDDFVIYLRFYKKKILTAILDTDHEVHYHRVDATRAWSLSRSTRIQQVQDAGEKDEYLDPVGEDGGFLWGIDTWWRMEQRDGGVYVESQSASLTRDIPAGLGWLLGPYVESVPRQSLTSTLEATRRELLRPLAAAHGLAAGQTRGLAIPGFMDYRRQSFRDSLEIHARGNSSSLRLEIT